MELLASVIGSRNLAHSAPVARSLYTVLQVGQKTHKESQVETEEVFFEAECTESLVVTIWNGQLQKVMYTQAVPLSLIAGSQKSTALWVAMYAPGDSRNFGFEDAMSPRPHEPQLHISLNIIETDCSIALPAEPWAMEQTRVNLDQTRVALDTSQSGSEADALRHTCQKLEEELALARKRVLEIENTGSLPSPSPVGTGYSALSVAVSDSDPTSAVREREKLVFGIKNKVADLAMRQRDVQSIEHQLHTLTAQLDEARTNVSKAEEELQLLTARRMDADRQKQEARNACIRAQETLRQHELSILELRSTHDATERQLSQVLAEQDRTMAYLSSPSDDSGLAKMAEELERWQGEVGKVTESIQECDERTGQLNRPDLDATQQYFGGDMVNEQIQSMQAQLEQAERELEEVRRNAAEQSSTMERAEEEYSAANARLTTAEEEAARSRAAVRHREADLRVEVEMAERELVTHAQKVALLEGQIDENRNQIREMNKHMTELVGRVDEQTDKLRDTQVATIGLDAQLRSHELEVTKRAVVSELDSFNSNLDELRAKRERLSRESAETATEAEEYSRLGEDVEAKAVQAEQALSKLKDQQERKHAEFSEAAAQMTELEAALLEAQERLREVDKHSVEATVADGEAKQRAARERELEGMISKLKSSLDVQRAEEQTLLSKRDAVLASVEEARKQVPERAAQCERLRLAEASLQDEKSHLEVSTRVAHQDLEDIVAHEHELAAILAARDEELDATSKDAVAKEVRRVELEYNIEAERTRRQREAEKLRSDITEAAGKRADLATQLEAMRARKRQLEEQAVSNLEATSLIAGVQKDCEDMEGQGSILERLKTLEEEEERCKIEESHLSEEAQELQQRLLALESLVDEDTREHFKLDTSLVTHRMQGGCIKTELDRTEEELAAHMAKYSAGATASKQVLEHTTTLEAKAASMRAQYKSAESVSEHARKLRSEVEAATTQQQRGREEHAETLANFAAALQGLETTLSGVVDGQNQELDRRIERIDQLERDVVAYLSRVDECGEQKSSLQRRLDMVERSAFEAKEQASASAARQVQMKQELESLEDTKRRVELRVVPTESRLNEVKDAAVKQRQLAETRSAELSALRARAARLVAENSARAQKLRGDSSQLQRRGVEAATIYKELDDTAKVARCQTRAAQEQLNVKQELLEKINSQISQHKMQLLSAKDQCQFAADQASHELLRLQQMKAAAPQDAAGIAAEEEKVRLLREQLAGRREALARSQADGHDLQMQKEDMHLEMTTLQKTSGNFTDKLKHSAETDNLQYSTIESLEKAKSKLEHETEVLTVGLHEAERIGEFLHKEHSLMRQQVDGVYQGSLRDWAAEVLRLKTAVEIQRCKDESSHWRTVAQDAEREFRSEVMRAQRRCEEAERSLREKLAKLQAEIGGEAKPRDATQHLDNRITGSVHSVPAALHGFVQPVPRPGSKLAVRRRALIIGCNYSRSHAPLQGASNDAWNLQCLLRHTLYYMDDQVLTLVDGSANRPTEPRRQPTKKNILDALKWLTADTQNVDNLLLYLGGYGTQQPVANAPGSFEAHFVPSDFAKDLPENYFRAQQPPAPQGGTGYRLVPMVEISRILAGLPRRCKVTVLLDCCHSVLPGLDPTRPNQLTFPRTLGLLADTPQQRAAASRARLLDLPPLPRPQSPPLPGLPVCRCHQYAACQRDQKAAELLIEGCVQGAFTWAFVKSLAAGHMNMTVEKHTKALQRIVGDLTQKFGWVDQVSHVQIVGSATSEDVVLVQEAENLDKTQQERRQGNQGIVDVNVELSKDRRLSKPAVVDMTAPQVQIRRTSEPAIPDQSRTPTNASPVFLSKSPNVTPTIRSKSPAMTPTMRSKSPTVTPSVRGKSPVRMIMPSSVNRMRPPDSSHTLDRTAPVRNLPPK